MRKEACCVRHSASMRPNAAFAARRTRRFFCTSSLALVGLSALLHVACASRLPIPDRTRGRTESYVEVPFPPPPPRPEHVPERPRSDAVWVDGEWDWDGTRYRWVRGAWILAPEGAKVAPWSVVRRDDGKLFYSPSIWYDASGRTIPAPEALVRGYVRDREAGAPPVVDASASAEARIDAGSSPEQLETPQELQR